MASYHSMNFSSSSRSMRNASMNRQVSPAPAVYSPATRPRLSQATFSPPSPPFSSRL